MKVPSMGLSCVFVQMRKRVSRTPGKCSLLLGLMAVSKAQVDLSSLSPLGHTCLCSEQPMHLYLVALNVLSGGSQRTTGDWRRVMSMWDASLDVMWHSNSTSHISREDQGFTWVHRKPFLPRPRIPFFPCR